MIGEKILHYKIIEKLGEGGMGVVYLAEDTKLERKVAIKFLPRHIAGNSEERERFKNEAKAAAALNHPNIATIYAIEESGDDTFIVMEFIDGIELKDKIKSGPISTKEAVNIAIQIAEGLGAAHKKGIVHRDIKSQNIMITKDSKVKIMDFGLAKVKGGTQLTKQGSTVGTAAYMSPEQAKGEEVDQRTDIWSFGVVLYEILAGKQPFKGDYEQAVIYSILNEEPNSILSIKKDLPPKFDYILMKLLTKSLETRYQDISKVINDLKNVPKEDLMQEKTPDHKSIAVLPFENISPDKDADYFADGLAEELIVNLSSLRDIRIISRTASMSYKGSKKDVRTIGRELEVSYVITGSVRKFQDDLRISIQLIEVGSNTQQWAETYKGKLADIFDIQEQVSKKIVDALMLKLTPNEKTILKKKSTSSSEAFDNYLRGKNLLYIRTKDSVLKSIGLFKNAINLDSQYADAYAALGIAYGTMYQEFESDESYLENAINSSLKALISNPSSADAYAALALAYFYKKLNEESFSAGQKAIELDPNNFLGYWILGRIYGVADKDREAVELFKKVIEINPDFYSAYSDMRMSYERLGEKEKMFELLETAYKVYSRHLARNPDDGRAHMVYAIDLSITNKIEEAKREVAKAIELNPTDPLMLYNAACFYSRIGEKELAINNLTNSMNAGYHDNEWTKKDPDLENIRNEHRYIELMKGK